MSVTFINLCQTLKHFVCVRTSDPSAEILGILWVIFLVMIFFRKGLQLHALIVLLTSFYSYSAEQIKDHVGVTLFMCSSLTGVSTTSIHQPLKKKKKSLHDCMIWLKCTTWTSVQQLCIDGLDPQDIYVRIMKRVNMYLILTVFNGGVT